MFTPFAEDDRIDVAGLIREAKFLKQCGVAGMVVGGSMGEGAGMSAEELSEAVRTVVEAVEGELAVFAAIIADSLAAYYRAITDASGIPLLIYNVMPTAQAAVESLEQLIEDNPAILGIKQSGRNIHTLAALVAVMAGKAKIFTAIDDMIFPCFMLGVDGTISGTSAIFPRQTVEMLNAVKSGQYAHALELHKRLSPVWRSVDFPDFAARAKFAATLGGRNVGRPRRPLQWPAGEA